MLICLSMEFLILTIPRVFLRLLPMFGSQIRPGGQYSNMLNTLQRPCSLASITTAAGRSTHCPGTLASITAAAGWSTQRCPWTLALIINIAAVS
ncbi:hypothetical protein ACOMHN_033347 [Nucella lapillus]